MLRPLGVRGGVRVALVAGLVSASTLIFSGSADAATTLSVRAGFDGYYLPGNVTPVRVEIAADRLVKGQLVAAASAGTSTIDVEASAGTVKDYILFVDTARGEDEQTINITLRDESGARVASSRGSIDAPDDRELVGLLPGVLAGGTSLPASAPLSVDVGTAKFVSLDEALLAHAPAGLYNLTAIGASPLDMTRLPDATRTAIVRWVADGGYLYVDAERGTDVQGLPRSWHPTRGDRTRAGFGEVVFTGGDMAAGNWNGLISPTARTRYASSNLQSFLPRMLAAEAGVRLPPLDVVFIILAIYILIAGPASYLVLRGRRREAAAWILIPVLAISFTVFSFIGAVGARGGARMAHGSILHTTNGASSATTVVAIAGSGKATQISFPGATSVATLFTTARARVQQTRDGVEATLPTQAGQVATAWASRPANFGRGLVVDATISDGQLTGTVRNETRLPLAETAVFVGDVGVGVGDLAPGASTEFSAAVPIASARRSVGFEVWRDLVHSQDERVNYGLWQSMANYGGIDVVAPGEVVAAGWTRDYSPTVNINGAARSPRGTSLVIGEGRVTAGKGPVSRLAVLREEVRGPQVFIQEPGRADFAGNEQATVYHFRLPVDPDDRKFEVVTTPAAGAEMWSKDGWQPLKPVDGVAIEGLPPGVPDPPVMIKRGGGIVIQSDPGVGFEGNEVVIEGNEGEAGIAVPAPVPPDMPPQVIGDGASATYRLPKFSGRDVYIRSNVAMAFDGRSADVVLQEVT